MGTGALLNANNSYEYLGYNPSIEYQGENAETGTFSENGGTNALNSSYLVVGASGLGNYSLGASALLTANNSVETISGYHGTGSFSQSGTNSLVSSDLYISGGGPGSYSLGSGALLTAASNSVESIGYSGTGSFTQTGGTNSISTGSAIYIAQGVGSIGTYNLVGGLLALSNSGILQGSGSAQFNFGGGTLGVTAPWSSSLAITLTGSGGNATVDTTGGSIGLSGVLSGTGGLNKNGPNTLLLTNANGYSGGTTINGSLLQMGNALVTGSTAAALTVNAGTLDVHGFSLNVGGLNGASTIDNFTGSGSVTVGNGNATSTFSGNIQNTIGQLTLTKVGTGALILNGVNTYSGSTAVNGGTLQLAGGLLASPAQWIGYSGPASFVQSGGTNAFTTASAGLTLGIGGTASYTLSGGLLLANNLSSEIIGSYTTGLFLPDRRNALAVHLHVYRRWGQRELFAHGRASFGQRQYGLRTRRLRRPRNVYANGWHQYSDQGLSICWQQLWRNLYAQRHRVIDRDCKCFRKSRSLRTRNIHSIGWNK